MTREGGRQDNGDVHLNFIIFEKEGRRTKKEGKGAKAEEKGVT